MTSNTSIYHLTHPELIIQSMRIRIEFKKKKKFFVEFRVESSIMNWSLRGNPGVFLWKMSNVKINLMRLCKQRCMKIIQQCKSQLHHPQIINFFFVFLNAVTDLHNELLCASALGHKMFKSNSQWIIQWWPQSIFEASNHFYGFRRARLIGLHLMANFN